MKVRHDFVTNSSSSSFVIAKHKDCTTDEIKAQLYNIKDRIEELICSWEGNLYCEHENEIKDAYDIDNLDVAVEYAIEDIVNEIISPYKETSPYYSPLKLDNWEVYCTNGDSESGYLFNCALYDCGWYMNTEHLKVQSEG